MDYPLAIAGFPLSNVSLMHIEIGKICKLLTDSGIFVLQEMTDTSKKERKKSNKGPYKLPTQKVLT